MDKIRRVFEVIIHNKSYDVYDIEGKEHSGYNDTPTTWWIYYSDKLPDGIKPPSDSEYFLPFSKQINRRLWDIKISQYNSSKYKWDEISFSNGTNVEMWCNGKLVYSFGTYDLAFAFAKIQYLKVVLSEHSFNFFEPEKENGRKICWYGLPATIMVKHSSWEVAIIPDYTAGLTKEEWWKELKRRESKITNDTDDDFASIEEEDYMDSMVSDYINWGDALSDEHIYWFRK